jgi:asparagine synthase (glutamine-hydrolysing)
MPSSIYQSYYKYPDYNDQLLFEFNFMPANNAYNYDYSSYKDKLNIALGIDYYNYLQGVLIKVDRATMYNGIESREPLLDHRLFEFLAVLPPKFKLSDNRQKIILKDIVHKYIPKELLYQHKIGFAPPIFDWLKDDLSDLVNEEFCNLEKMEFFNGKYLSILKSNFFNNKLHNESIIWKLIQFSQWYKHWMASFIS